jgi:restriction system protein
MIERPMGTPIVRAPLFPTNTELANAMRAFDGEPVKQIRDTFTAIWEQTGTPQNPVDWSDPDTWIVERLTGDLRTIAQKIWNESRKTLNPRHAYGCYLFINRTRLLGQIGGNYRLSGRGKLFLSHDETVLRELDASEGIPKVLSLVAERSPCKRGDILLAWSDYLKAVSRFSTEATFKETLRRRLANLVERGLIAREGNSYAITDAGLNWLKRFSESSETRVTSAVPSSKRTTVAQAAHAHNEEQLVAFRARLMALEPA